MDYHQHPVCTHTLNALDRTQKELDRLKKLTWARKIQEMKKLESELLTVREEERFQDVVKRQAMAQRKKLGFFNTKEGYDLDYNP